MQRACTILAVGLFCLTAGKSTSAADTAKTAAAMTDVARQLVGTLDVDAKAKTIYKFDDPKRRDWHNIPKADRKGLQIGAMSPQQRDLCHQLLKTTLSDSGYRLVTQIMSLENILHIIPSAAFDLSMYGPEKYYLTIFGQPDLAGTWGWSFEGHHISLNLVIRDGQVVSDTPNFFGANPVVNHTPQPGSPPEGTRTLGPEELLAFDLVNSLDDAQRKKAVIAERSPRDYRTPGAPDPPQGAPRGIAASELTETQKKFLLSLLETYCGNLNDELKAQRLTDVKAGGLDKLFFAWAGETKAGAAHYYCVQGPGLLLELCNAQAGAGGDPANHIHSVWRNPRGDFAIPIK